MKCQVEMMLPAVPGDEILGTPEPFEAESQAPISSLGVCCTNSGGLAAPEWMFCLIWRNITHGSSQLNSRVPKDTGLPFSVAQYSPPFACFSIVLPISMPN